MIEFHIRPAKGDDLPQMSEMIHALSAHHGDTATTDVATLGRDVLGDAPWVTLLVAQAGERLLGYAALCPLAQLQFGLRGMDMHHLFVAPVARGTGVGRALIDASVEQAKAQGCRYLTVGTHPDNTCAQDVYRAIGFEDASAPGPRFRLKW